MTSRVGLTSQVTFPISHRQLYDIEDRAQDLTHQERLSLRSAESRPILDEFKAWLDLQKSDSHVFPKSAIGGAVRYTLNPWKSLVPYVTDGSLPIDNNDTERDLRRLTMGRGNWLFLGSPAGGEVAARMCTVIASASRPPMQAGITLIAAPNASRMNG